MRRFANKHLEELRQEIEILLNRQDLDPSEKIKSLSRLDRSYQFWRQFV